VPKPSIWIPFQQQPPPTHSKEKMQSAWDTENGSHRCRRPSAVVTYWNNDIAISAGGYTPETSLIALPFCILSFTLSVAIVLLLLRSEPALPNQKDAKNTIDTQRVLVCNKTRTPTMWPMPNSAKDLKQVASLCRRPWLTLKDFIPPPPQTPTNPQNYHHEPLPGHPSPHPVGLLGS